MKPETAKTFATVVKRSLPKNPGSRSHSDDHVFVREDFYNGYREECCQKGCRLEEALEFCGTLT